MAITMGGLKNLFNYLAAESNRQFNNLTCENPGGRLKKRNLFILALTFIFFPHAAVRISDLYCPTEEEQSLLLSLDDESLLEAVTTIGHPAFSLVNELIKQCDIFSEMPSWQVALMQAIPQDLFAFRQYIDNFSDQVICDDSPIITIYLIQCNSLLLDHVHYHITPTVATLVSSAHSQLHFYFRRDVRVLSSEEMREERFEGRPYSFRAVFRETAKDSEEVIPVQFMSERTYDSTYRWGYDSDEEINQDNFPDHARTPPRRRAFSEPSKGGRAVGTLDVRRVTDGDQSDAAAVGVGFFSTLGSTNVMTGTGDTTTVRSERSSPPLVLVDGGNSTTETVTVTGGRKGSASVVPGPLPDSSEQGSSVVAPGHFSCCRCQ